MKNVKFSKKLLSMLTAGVLMATPVMANADSNEDTNTNNGFELIKQDKEFRPLNMNEFFDGVKSSYDYLSQFISYDNMQEDLQCLYYLVNREYIQKEDEEELINSGYVYETNFDEQKYENFMRAYNLINVIADYNQSTIRETEDVTKLIDVSNLCYSEDDIKLVHDMHMNYFNAYQNGRFDNEYYQMVFKQLTTLNAAEQAGNASELSVGARWTAQNSIGGGVMQLLRDDMQEDFTTEELYQYFDRTQLNMGQWILRDDLTFDLNCLSEHEYEVFNFGQLWVFVYDKVNNDMLRELENVRKYCADICVDCASYAK